MHTWVTVAHLAKAKTLTGELVARGAAGSPVLFSEGLEVAFVPPQLDAPRCGRVVSLRPEAKGAVLVGFDTVRDRDVSERLAGCFCLARRADLPEDALPFLDGGTGIEGFEVFDEREGLVGTAERIEELPGQHLLSVRRADGSTFLVPLVDEIVLGLDEDARRIDVDLPNGLLDL